MDKLAPPYPLIREGLEQGKVIPFLGAGASLSHRNPGQVWDIGNNACLPSSDELARYLARKTQFPRDEKKFDLPTIALYYDVVAGRPPLHEDLHRIFDSDFSIAPIHKFLASLDRSLLIVTTNYDDLIERALTARRRPYDLVIHTTDPNVGDQVLWLPHGEAKPKEVSPNKLFIDLGEVTVVYKIHGTVDRQDPQRDQYVITENDYIDFLTRLMRKKAIPAIFAEPFCLRHFLFLGYGLRDWNLRVVLNGIEKNMRQPRRRSWAIQQHPSRIEQRFWQERGVEVYDIPLREFVQQLTSC